MIHSLAGGFEPLQRAGQHPQPCLKKPLLPAFLPFSIPWLLLPCFCLGGAWGAASAFFHREQQAEWLQEGNAEKYLLKQQANVRIEDLGYEAPLPMLCAGWGWLFSLWKQSYFLDVPLPLS